MKKEILPSPPQQPKKHEGLGGKFVVVVAAVACVVLFVFSLDIIGFLLGPILLILLILVVVIGGVWLGCKMRYKPPIAPPPLPPPPLPRTQSEESSNQEEEKSNPEERTSSRRPQ